VKRLLILMALSGCCQAATSMPLKDWTRDEQRQILAEERKLPSDSILIPVLEDYAKLRREVR
jgi:hypothetical protein